MSLKKLNPQKIESAIADFEKEVDFELVPVITLKSSYTEHIAWILSLVLFLAFVSGIDFLLQYTWVTKIWYYSGALFLALLLGHILDRSDIVDRFFISHRERARQAYEKAQRIFFLKHLNEIKKQNSLVLFVSVMERKIVILPDPRLKFEGLQELQQRLLQVIQDEFGKREFEQGFLKAIEFLKTELKPRFPRQKDDIANDVPNRIIFWKD